MDKLKIWDSVKQPPSYALKTIQGGRLKGKTDINPQWRYQVMTEQFGICGVGWSYDVVDLWTVAVGEEVVAFAKIMLYVKTDGELSSGIPGVGGSMLVAKEANGIHVSDEAYKMAITDALSVAMKMLGVAADIYAGLFDGTKYKDEPKATPKSTPKTELQYTQKMLADKALEKGYTPELVKAIMARLFHAGGSKDLNQEQMEELMGVMENGEYKGEK